MFVIAVMSEGAKHLAWVSNSHTPIYSDGADNIMKFTTEKEANAYIDRNRDSWNRCGWTDMFVDKAA
jgi:hypothetical protein